MCLLPEVREIALTGSEILACGSSEIILCEDSEITAVPAVVKRMAARRAAELYHCCQRQQFRFVLRSERHIRNA